MSDDVKLGKAETRVLRGVCDMPLISAYELARVLGGVFSTASRRLNSLEQLGLVDCALMGASFPAAKRYRLTPAGARRFFEPEVYFHLTRNVNKLAHMMPGLEWFYRWVVRLPQIVHTGAVGSFHWRLKDGIDAVAHYEHGTVAFIWSGPWQTKARLAERLVELGGAAPQMGGWPALLCVVASDHWQADVVSGLLDDFGLQRGALTVCAETKLHPSNPVLGGNASRLTMQPLLGSLQYRVRAEQPRMMQGVRGGRDASSIYRLIYELEQFPGARTAAISRGLDSKPSSVYGKLKRLVNEQKLVQVGGNHYLSDELLGVAAGRDRVHFSRPGRRFGLREDGLPAVARYRAHDAAAFSIVSVFQKAGFHVAGGWRGDDYSGGTDAIAPDAMIYMGKNSSGGAGWYYLEYERRASSASTVERKLRGYVSRHAKGGFLPVLMAARTESVAAEFRQQAAAAGLPLWAASMASIKVEFPGTILGFQTAWLDASGTRAVLLRF